MNKMKCVKLMCKGMLFGILIISLVQSVSAHHRDFHVNLTYNSTAHNGYYSNSASEGGFGALDKHWFVESVRNVRARSGGIVEDAVTIYNGDSKAQMFGFEVGYDENKLKFPTLYFGSYYYHPSDSLTLTYYPGGKWIIGIYWDDDSKIPGNSFGYVAYHFERKTSGVTSWSDINRNGEYYHASVCEAEINTNTGRAQCSASRRFTNPNTGPLYLY